MTNDKAVYTIEFADEVSTGAESTILNAADPEVLVIETQTNDNILTVTVWGDSNAIPVFEEEFKTELEPLYPSMEITNVETYPGQGTERTPQ